MYFIGDQRSIRNTFPDKEEDARDNSNKQQHMSKHPAILLSANHTKHS